MRRLVLETSTVTLRFISSPGVNFPTGCEVSTQPQLATQRSILRVRPVSFVTLKAFLSTVGTVSTVPKSTSRIAGRISPLPPELSSSGPSPHAASEARHIPLANATRLSDLEAKQHNMISMHNTREAHRISLNASGASRVRMPPRPSGWAISDRPPKKQLFVSLVSAGPKRAHWRPHQRCEYAYPRPCRAISDRVCGPCLTVT